MRAFLTTLPENAVFYRQRASVEGLAREGYFGGLTFMHTQEELTNVTYLDINAAFAHAMRQGVPTRSGCHTDIEYDNLPGIYECQVVCPPSVPFRFLPWRDPKSYRVSWNKPGRFKTVLCSHTIELARSVGYDIKVIEGYVFDGVEDVFGDFVNKCEGLELQYKKRGAGIVIKVLRNSLYGKFGQRTRVKEYYLTANPTDEMTPVMTFEGQIIDNLYFLELEITRPYMMPSWAAWITATARNTLARAVYALGVSKCHYGGTDALLVDNSVLDQALLPIGERYGEWKVAHRFARFKALAQNFYVAYGLDGEPEAVQVKAAGISRGVLTASEVEQILPSHPTLITRPHLTARRAINTTGGRAHSDPAVKTITIEFR